MGGEGLCDILIHKTKNTLIIAFFYVRLKASPQMTRSCSIKWIFIIRIVQRSVKTQHRFLCERLISLMIHPLSLVQNTQISTQSLQCLNLAKEGVLYFLVIYCN